MIFVTWFNHCNHWTMWIRVEPCGSPQPHLELVASSRNPSKSHAWPQSPNIVHWAEPKNAETPAPWTWAATSDSMQRIAAMNSWESSGDRKMWWNLRKWYVIITCGWEGFQICQSSPWVSWVFLSHTPSNLTGQRYRLAEKLDECSWFSRPVMSSQHGW